MIYNRIYIYIRSLVIRVILIVVITVTRNVDVKFYSLLKLCNTPSDIVFISIFSILLPRGLL